MFTNDPLTLWQHIHGASSHFPIALLIFSALFDFGATILRRPEWRIVGFSALVIGALMTLPAVASGLTGFYGWFGISPYYYDPKATSLLTHRTFALIGGGLSLFLALWRTLRRDKLAGVEWGLYLAAIALCVALISYVGLLGGWVARGA